MAALNAKKKGNAGEIELCGILNKHGKAWRNDQWHYGSFLCPDIQYNDGRKTYHVECKRLERINIYAVMERCIEESDDGFSAVPVVIFRHNHGEWFVCTRLSDWLKK